MLSYMVHKHCKDLNIWTSYVCWIIKLKSRNIHTKMATKNNVRWAFNASAWKPTEEQVVAASSYIQLEEKLRISKYVFQNDAKSSLIGRLMLRKYAHISTSIPYAEVKFGRDDRGKPYLLGLGDSPVNFNVSHQGDYVVLAGNTGTNVGIDVMKIEPPVNKNIPEFFRLMKRQFSPHEWTTIRSFPTETEQIACFYRLWCLKESYVKNIGLGITIPLNEISFSIKTMKLDVGEIITDTVLYERDIKKHDWVFEETLLDETHAVAVASIINRKKPAVPYQFLTFEDLVKEAKPLFDSDQKFAAEFVKKQMKSA